MTDCKEDIDLIWLIEKFDYALQSHFPFAYTESREKAEQLLMEEDTGFNEFRVRKVKTLKEVERERFKTMSLEEKYEQGIDLQDGEIRLILACNQDFYRQTGGIPIRNRKYTETFKQWLREERGWNRLVDYIEKKEAEREE
ncbi:MAG: hypothetical protein R6U96_04670 [Promethearchaeia archaeon]